MGKDFCSFQQVVEPCGFISFLQNKQKVLIIKKQKLVSTYLLIFIINLETDTWIITYMYVMPEQTIWQK